MMWHIAEEARLLLKQLAPAGWPTQELLGKSFGWTGKLTAPLALCLIDLKTAPQTRGFHELLCKDTRGTSVSPL